MTKTILKKKGVAFEEKNVEENPQWKKEVLSLGYVSMPIVVTPTESWSGFRIDRITALA